MDENTLGVIQSVIDLGLVGVLMAQTIILYRAYSSMTDRYLAHLERISERVTTLTAPLSVPPFLAERVAADLPHSDNVTS